MSLNLSLVKMPHSNFKDKAYAFNTGVGKCSCGKTFKYASERYENEASNASQVLFQSSSSF